MKSNPNTQPTCEYTHYHLTASEFALYDLARAWSKGTGILFFDGDKLSRQYQSFSQSNTYKLRDSLEEKGWFVRTDGTGPRSARRGGKWTPRTYRVLSHEEWASIHGAAACPRINDDGLVKEPKGSAIPLSSDGEPVTSTDSPFHSQEKPFHPQESTIPLTGKTILPSSDKQVIKHLKKARKEAGSPPADFSSPHSSDQKVGQLGLLEERSSIPPFHSAVMVKSTIPLSSDGVGEVFWDGTRQRYFNSITGKDVYVDEINRRIAPNTFSGSAFFDPAGNKITLEKAQEKELACQ